MGVFLLFDEGARLVQQRQMPSGNHGTTDPLTAFPGGLPESFTAHEVTPEALRGIVPDVYAGLTTHAVRAGAYLQVDPVDVIQARVNALALDQLHDQMLEIGRQAVAFDDAVHWLQTTIGYAPIPRHSAVRQHLVQTAVEQRDLIKSWKAGEKAAELPQMLVDLAGKRLPL